MNEASKLPITADKVARLLVDITQGQCGHVDNQTLNPILHFIEVHTAISRKEVLRKLVLLFRAPADSKYIEREPHDQRLHVQTIILTMGHKEKAKQLYHRMHAQNLALELAHPSVRSEQQINEALAEIDEDKETKHQRVDLYKRWISQGSGTHSIGESSA